MQEFLDANQGTMAYNVGKAVKGPYRYPNIVLLDPHPRAAEQLREHQRETQAIFGIDEYIRTPLSPIVASAERKRVPTLVYKINERIREIGEITLVFGEAELNPLSAN